MKVLFVCAGNINRSQIAEAIFNKLSKKNRAVSAGTNAQPGFLKNAPDNPIVPMKKFGYNLSKAKTRKLDKQIINSADKVVFIFNRKRHEDEIPTHLKNSPHTEFWEINSIPLGLPFDKYCRLEEKRIQKIEKLVKDLVKRIG